MKKICKLFFILSVVLQFTACSFFNSVDEGSETRESMITLSISDEVYTNDNSRTAIPSFYESTMWTRWTLLIEDHPEVTFSQIGDSHSYKINTSIEPGTYTITAKLLDSSGLPFLSGSKSITIQSGGYYYDNIVLTYMPSGEGFVALDFKFPTSIVSHVKCIFDGNQITDSVAINANGTYSFTQDAVTTGTHVLNLILLKQEGTNYIPLYIISEEIIVKPNLTTSTWLVNGSSYINSSNQFELTETKLQKLISHTVYVMGTNGTLSTIASDFNFNGTITGSNSNIGTILSPYASLSAAIAKILTVENNEASTESVPYKIVVSGTLSGTNAQLTLTEPAHDLYLEIAGFAGDTVSNNDSRKDILDVNNLGNAITVDNGTNNLHLTVKNLEIKNATNTTNNAYGILDSRAGSLMLEQCYIHDCDNGIKLSGNTCTISNTDITNNNHGYGIYSDGQNNIKLKGQINIYQNKNTAVLSNIYIDNNTAKLELIGPVTSVHGIFVNNFIPTVTTPLVAFTQNYGQNNPNINPDTIFHSDKVYTIGWNADHDEAAMGIVVGNITPSVVEDVTFVPSGISFRSGQEKKVTITPKILGTEIAAESLTADNFKMGVTTYGTELTLTTTEDTTKPYFVNTNKNTIKFPNNTPPEGLIVWATFKYNGVTYSCSFPLCNDILSYNTYADLPFTFGVSNQEGLEKIKSLITSTNNFSNKNIIIDEDFTVDTLPGIGFISGDQGNSFDGTIDGTGHTITVHSFEEKGFIFNLHGCIKNLTLAGEWTTNQSCAASFTYFCGGTVMNCTNKCNITSTRNSSYVGGIVAYPTSTDCCIKNCVNEGELKATGNYGNAGGIVAYEGNSNGFVIKNCINKGNITSTNGDAGGISTGFYGYIINCVNMGTVTAKNSAGGITSEMTPKSNSDIQHGLYNNYNCGVIKADTYVGGICGKIVSNTGTCYIKNCVNSGEVKKNTESSNPTLGGILGKSLLTNSSQVILDNNYYISATFTGYGNIEDSTTATSFTSYNDILNNLNTWVTNNPTITFMSKTHDLSRWIVKTIDSNVKFDLEVFEGE